MSVAQVRASSAGWSASARSWSNLRLVRETERLSRRHWMTISSEWTAPSWSLVVPPVLLTLQSTLCQYEQSRALRLFRLALLPLCLHATWTCCNTYFMPARDFVIFNVIIQITKAWSCFRSIELATARQQYTWIGYSAAYKSYGGSGGPQGSRTHTPIGLSMVMDGWASLCSLYVPSPKLLYSNAYWHMKTRDRLVLGHPRQTNTGTPSSLSISAFSPVHARMDPDNHLAQCGSSCPLSASRRCRKLHRRSPILSAKHSPLGGCGLPPYPRGRDRHFRSPGDGLRRPNPVSLASDCCSPRLPSFLAGSLSF